MVWGTLLHVSLGTSSLIALSQAGLKAHACGALQLLVSNMDKPTGSPSIFFLEERKRKPGLSVQVICLCTDPFSSWKSHKELLKADVA